jgi:LAO/AO transport system kinase
MRDADQPGVDGLRERVLRGEVRAIARAISLVESGAPDGQALLQELRARGGGAWVIGITGAPGSGKSTLTDALVGEARRAGSRVAVVAVDPSSPFTGGAILGDRIRMTRWHDDSDVFIRSMAARGHLGGLAAASLQVVALLDAVGYDTIFLETVGVGQSEVEIAQAADSTVLVLTPGQGDAVQAFKAGIMEIADLFVINKADQPGAARLRREIRGMLHLAPADEGAWRQPILETVSSRQEGTGEVLAEVGHHARFLRSTGRLAESRRRRARFEIGAILQEELRRSLEGREDAFVDQVLSGSITPAQAVERLLGR